MRRTDYVIKRALFAIVTVFVAITINFFLFRVLPGNASATSRGSPTPRPQLRHSLEVEFGLDKPKWQQYLIYLKELVHGNMGISFANQQPVWDNLRADLANTIPMVTLGTVIAILIGILTGVLSAWRRGTKLDHVEHEHRDRLLLVPDAVARARAAHLPLALVPEPRDDQRLPDQPDAVGALQRRPPSTCCCPSLTLALTLYGEYTLIVRSAMLETLGEDYVLTARAKGLPQRRIVVRHALRNAMLPTTTLIALSLGYIVAGAILIETVYSWPGIGNAVYQAVIERDYPMLQGAFLVLTVSVVFFNFLADLLYFRLDPRITE